MSTTVEPHIVSIAEIRDAAERIRGVATRTPLLRWDDTTWLKPESLQPVGAFKMRGAYNKVASLTDAERARGVVTYSSGNHAQAVARAARLLGATAVICMPENAPRVKVEGVLRDGAEIVTTGNDSEERHQRALQLVEERGLVMVEPYDDPAIIAGQGTCGLEIVEDLPGVTSVLVPVSGGGLSSGVATAVKALAPSARVIGVEPELAADAKESLERGELVSLDRRADGPHHGRRPAHELARPAALRAPAPLHGRDRDRQRGRARRCDAPARSSGRGWWSNHPARPPWRRTWAVTPRACRETTPGW